MAESLTAESASVETRKEAERVAGEAKYWQGQIALAESDHRDWIKDGRSVQKRYKGKTGRTLKSSEKRFNILFSNVETLKGALFARMAKPDIRRRFADRDPIGRQIAEIVERSAVYCQDAYDSEKAVERAIEDYLLPGRGLVRVHYDAETATGEDGKEYVARQELYESYVPWDDFLHEPAKTWDRINWISFRHRMSRDDLKKNGFRDADKIPLNWSPNPDDDKVPDAYKRAEVFEVWDKSKRERVWVVKGVEFLLRKDTDPYGLEDFYPVAEPLQAVVTNDTFIPEPEFNLYKDQADGLDEIEARIDRLTRALKRRGVYDATFKELVRLAKAADNEFIPVKNYADLSQKGGLAAAFQSEDIAAIAKVLAELHVQRDLRVQTIYEVVGIADIMRGSSDPRETLGAQKIKAQFGGNRLKKRQDKVQKWIRDTLRLKAEIIAEHFEPQKLAEMTGFTLGEPRIDQTGQPSVEGLITPDMIRIMRKDRLRSYRIDVETDSTIFEDAEAEKQARTEMITSMTAFLEKAVMAGQAMPELTPLMFETLAFGLRGFKTGRQLEEVVDETRDRVLEKMKNPQPQPDPKLEAEKVKAQAAREKAQIDIQTAQARHQMEIQKMQAEMQKMQAELQIAFQKLGIKRQEMAMDAERQQAEMAMNERRISHEMEAEERRAEMGAEADRRKHDMSLQMIAEKAKRAKQDRANQ